MAGTAVERRIALGDFRRLMVGQIRRLLVQARQAEEIKAAGGFVGRDEALVIRRTTLIQAVADLETLGADAKTRFPDLTQQVDDTLLLVKALSEASDAAAILVVFERVMDLFGVPVDVVPAMSFELTSAGAEIELAARDIPDDADGLSLGALQAQYDDQSFLRAVANRIAASRRAGQTLSRDDLAAIAAAYRLLDRGVTLPPDYQSIGTSGFRLHQTRLSLADPGDGHVSVTCADRRLLDGVIVHIEHIDRGGVDDREVVEAYRLPAALNAARVRLHAGSAAPCTAYIGRPVFENGVSVRLRTEAPAYMPVAFAHDLLKTAHLTASACSAMFVNGIADCKIAIERMGAKDTLLFMTAVAGNVMRDPARQFLSAAFNLTLPIWDDRGALPRLVSDPYEIGLLAIDLAVDGQFDKVTWDGAANRQPSDPILKRLRHDQWVTLVHLAHERGLETYLSAGLRAPDMRACVQIGVDGVGIGTSLHYTDPKKPMGQLKPDAILEALRVRDEAETEPVGRAARLLARLDRMVFEKTLPVGLDADRLSLFAALRDLDQPALEALLERIGPMSAPTESSHPIIAQAERTLKSSGSVSLGEQQLGGGAWRARLRDIDRLLQVNDVTGLREVMR